MKKICFPDAEPYFDLLALAFEIFEVDGLAAENGRVELYVSDVLAENTEFQKVLNDFVREMGLNFRIETVEEQNWNALWESNFEPIIVGRYLRIRAPFHESDPSFDYEIVINPRMSFGTGHHATTRLMLEALLRHNLKGKKVLDMGTGTGVLAILAEHLGASEVDAIDYDPNSFENAVQNTTVNTCRKVRVLQGDEKAIPSKGYDLILANINRETIKKQLPAFREAIANGGTLLCSGFLLEDEASVSTAAGASGFIFIEKNQENPWLMIEFKATPT